MHRFIEYLRNRRRDLEENLEAYLKALRILAERHGGRAYLYGSRARGDALPSSDVDVLIVVPNNVDRLKVLHQARRLVPNTLVEINVLNEDEAEIFMRLVKTVKPIKGEDKEPSWKTL